MSKMTRPTMEVIRFKESDIVVASGAGFSNSKFGNGVAGDGVVTYNGTPYAMSSYDAVSSFLGVLAGDGIRNAGISNGSTTQSLRGVLEVEASRGAGAGWNGSYVYDSTATWNNGTTDLRGVFKKQ